MMGVLQIRDLDPLFFTIQYRTDLFTQISSLNALWNAFMGNQTLADLVAGIFTGVSSALASVKSGLEAAWDGIKNTGEYIIDSVLDAIFYGITQIGRLFLSTWLYIAMALSQKPVTVDLGSDGVTARFPDGSSTNFLVKYQNRKMLLNGTTLDFMNPLSGLENLSVDLHMLSAVLIGVFPVIVYIFASAIFLLAAASPNYRFLIAISAILSMLSVMHGFNILLLNKTNQETSDLYGQIMTNFLGSLTTGAVLSWRDTGKKFSKRAMLTIGVSMGLTIASTISKVFDPFSTTTWDEVIAVIIWTPISTMIALALTTLMEEIIGKGGYEGTLGLLSALLFLAGASYLTVFHIIEVKYLHVGQ